MTRAAELPSPLLLGGSRLVIHIQTSTQAVEDLINLIRVLADEKVKAGFVPSPEAYATKRQNIYVRAKPEKKN